MKKTPEQLVEEILALVSELAEMAEHKKHTLLKQPIMPKPEKEKSGATGGVRILVDEGYLDTPRLLLEIIERLKQEGRHYSNATISMGLLNLVRERVLTRFRDNDKKGWKYVIRK